MDSRLPVDLVVLASTERDGPAAFGKQRVVAALRRKGYNVRHVSAASEAEAAYLLVVGTLADWQNTEAPLLDELLANQEGTGHFQREGLTIAGCHGDGKSVLGIIGCDDIGLMYGLLEVAANIDKGKALQEIASISEAPQVPVRGIFTFLHNEDLEREWFYSYQFWADYFAMLASNRYNSFNLVFSHQTPYLAPLFPFFIEVPEHREVQGIGFSPEERKRNLEMLQIISQLSEERGIEFVLGVWQVCSWKDSLSDGREQVTTMVDGLHADNLESYTYHALRRLLQACPAIKGVQVRVNNESGVSPAMQTEFFKNTVWQAIQDMNGRVYLDLRYWRAQPETIQSAVDMGIPLRLSMKYWAEHQGPPYQASMQLPSYSYADFIRYPAAAPLIYQLWSLGTHRILLWGDPDYGRRFAESMQLGQSVGFETNPPLAQKGYGNEPGYWRLLGSRELEHYTWEYERYWFYYLVFGRLTYNPQASPEVWQRELRARFGDAAEAMEELYKVASKVLSFLIQYQMSDPNMYTWPEIDTGGVLDYYMQTPPSDPALIDAIGESAKKRLANNPDARLTPQGASAYLNQIGKQILALVKEMQSVNVPAQKELRGTLVDFGILGNLALFHSAKYLSAECLALYYHTADLAVLQEAKAYMEKAADIWDELAALGKDFFYDGMVTGPIDTGHWQDKQVLNADDLARLEQLEELYQEYAPFHYAFDFGGVPAFRSRESGQFAVYSNYHVERHFSQVHPRSLYQPDVGYGWQSGSSVEGVAHSPVRLADRDLDTKRRDTGWEYGDKLVGLYNALYDDCIYGVTPAVFLADIPDGEYEASIIVGTTANGESYGPMSIDINGTMIASQVQPLAGNALVQRAVVKVQGGRINLGIWAEDGGTWCLSGLVLNRVGIHTAHVPPHMCIVGEDVKLRVSAKAIGVGLGKVQMRLAETVLPLTSVSPGVYEVVVPKKLLTVGKEFAYTIETIDDSGTVWPSEKKTYQLKVTNGGDAPVVTAASASEMNADNQLVVKVRVKADRPLQFARLHYRYLNQYYRFASTNMQLADNEAHGDVFVGYIPGSYIDDRWDLMYFIEVVDEAGEGAWWPNPAETAPYVIIPTGRRKSLQL